MKNRPGRLAVLCLALGIGASASGQDRATFEVWSWTISAAGTS